MEVLQNPVQLLLVKIVRKLRNAGIPKERRHRKKNELINSREETMKYAIPFMLALFMTFGNASGKVHSWKGKVHLAAVPFIEGTGIYSDVRMLQTAGQAGTKAGAITNLSLLAVQAGLGSTILFSGDDLPLVFRLIHRIVGTGIIASALWISIEGSIDNGIPSAAHYTAYAHTIFAAAPLILFTF